MSGKYISSFIFGFLILFSVSRLILGPRTIHTVTSGTSSSSLQALQPENGQDDKFPWVQQYQKEFPFSMQQTPVCRATINEPRLLSDLAQVAIRDWQQKGGWDQPHDMAIDLNEKLSPQMQQAEETWRRVLDSCHGPLPDPTTNPAFAANYTLRAFMKGLAKCGDPTQVQLGGHFALFSGEWCNAGFRDFVSQGFFPDLRKPNSLGDIQEKLGLGQSQHSGKDVFVLSARCALKFEFPVVRPQTEAAQATIPNRQKLPAWWKPKRVIVLSPTMGKRGAPMGCKLIGSAYPRGWEVVFIEGHYQGIRYKYSDAIRALQLVVSNSAIAAEDILVVFADSMDMLVQRTPEYVTEAFLDMTSLFAFSSEPTCFPMGIWPHSLGVPYQTCDNSYPKTFEGHYREGNKYANTGGWIGLASSAFVVLKELATLVENEGQDTRCHEHGTDQLLGNAAYLRSPALVGLDYNYTVIASDGWHLLGEENPLQLGPSQSELDHNNWVYRHAASEESILSPAFLHFNGGGSSGGMLDEGYEALISNSTLKSCRQGKVTIVHLAKEKVWAEDFAKAKRWNTCSANNYCVKQQKKTKTRV